MRRKTLLAAWFSAPILPIAVYGIRLGGVLNAYFLSVALGLAAYTWFCGLLVLNSRPAYALKALGEEGLTTLMAKAPILILCVSLVHRVLKVGLFSRLSTEALPGGFLASTFQTIRRGLTLGATTRQGALGVILLVLLSVFVGLGYLFLKRTAGSASRVGKLRGLVFASQGWTAWGSLVLYLGTGAISILALWHILSASSTSFSSNPVGASLLLAELGYGLFSWLGARIREGWKAPSPRLVKGRLGPRT